MVRASEGVAAGSPSDGLSRGLYLPGCVAAEFSLNGARQQILAELDLRAALDASVPPNRRCR